jgi:SPP1 gp7 family putative phage head morphogenesis protein
MGISDLFKKKKVTTEQETIKTNNEIRTETYKKNSHLFSGYRFLATLSSKTCLACGALDGKIFDTPELPHVCLNEHCRCIMVPVVRGMEKPDPDDTRASEDGPVPASMTYEKWLKKQPAKIKRAMLGEHYERYKNGTTLQELAELIRSK